jgi:uncharacterized protein (DUF433 family)
MVGKPVIRGTRLTVDFILNLLAHGSTEDDILNEYEGLEIEDIQACFLFATKFLKNTDFMPLMEETSSLSDQAMVLNFIRKHSKDRCFSVLACAFQGQKAGCKNFEPP